MRIDVYVPLLLSTLFGVAAPWAVRRLPPRAATWLLTCTAVVAAGTWATALALLAFTLVGQIPLVASQGPWSAGVLAANDPVHRSVALVCALVLLASVAGLTVVSWRRVRVLVDSWRECRELVVAGDLAVVDDPVPTAFALPGMPGRIVVSSGMLRALSGDERRALLAHERAHLRHRHHLFLLVLQLAAAVHPLLRPLAREGAFTVERWADEEAAAEVADRTLVAQAVARAALATKRAPQRALAATGGPVPRRVQALLAPPAPVRRSPVLACAALALVCFVSLAEAAHDTERLFEHAMHTSAATHQQPR
ncbi:M56 family metallopeptidase [Streptomyces sp. NPDC058469]|uniref:M56 family metallopeptidase n=1 Tax=Streptomyces sp. NPDC058469 TaxID=3346514 RepID=UPI0036697004